jgi:hypothetical protein
MKLSLEWRSDGVLGGGGNQKIAAFKSGILSTVINSTEQDGTGARR